jgi:hypothetical protein
VIFFFSFFLSGDCTFDVDMCSWTNSQADDFDWLMGSGTTTTSGTGPDTDHTMANGTGKLVVYVSAVLTD